MKVVLSLKQVFYSYPDSKAAALENISFEIKKGDFVGLVGPNGAGKTTLMSLIASLSRPDSGEICVADGTRPPKETVTLAPQEIALYPTLTSVENLVFFSRLGGVEKAQINEQVRWVLEFVGLTAQKDVRVSTYSGGMKRRLNLAVALVTNPQILQLDEPTVGVDPQSRHLIVSALKQLNREGTTIIYSSHYLEEIEQLCSHLILLDHGEKIFDGTVDEFKRDHSVLGTVEDGFMERTGRQLRDR